MKFTFGPVQIAVESSASTGECRIPRAGDGTSVRCSNLGILDILGTVAETVRAIIDCSIGLAVPRALGDAQARGVGGGQVVPGLITAWPSHTLSLPVSAWMVVDGIYQGGIPAPYLQPGRTGGWRPGRGGGGGP